VAGSFVLRNRQLLAAAKCYLQFERMTEIIDQFEQLLKNGLECLSKSSEQEIS